jgi:hypothetical protein
MDLLSCEGKNLTPRKLRLSIDPLNVSHLGDVNPGQSFGTV